MRTAKSCILEILGGPAGALGTGAGREMRHIRPRSGLRCGHDLSFQIASLPLGGGVPPLEIWELPDVVKNFPEDHARLMAYRPPDAARSASEDQEVRPPASPQGRADRPDSSQCMAREASGLSLAARPHLSLFRPRCICHVRCSTAGVQSLVADPAGITGCVRIITGQTAWRGAGADVAGRRRIGCAGRAAAARAETGACCGARVPFKPVPVAVLEELPGAD